MAAVAALTTPIDCGASDIVDEVVARPDDDDAVAVAVDDDDAAEFAPIVVVDVVSPTMATTCTEVPDNAAAIATPYATTK